MDDLNIRLFFSLINCVINVGSRSTFQHKHRFSRHQHTAAPKAVDKLRLVGINARDNLRRNHFRLNAVFFVQSQPVQHHLPGFNHRRLVERMHFEHAKFAFHNLRAWFGFRGLHRDIHNAEYFVAGRHLNIKRSHPLHRQVSLGDGAHKSSVLCLHAVNETITS